MLNLLDSDLPRTSLDDPHAGQRIVCRGAPIGAARLVTILLHGRGRTPEHILDIAHKLAVPDIAYVAPAAANNSWYPKSFLEPITENEPGLSSSMRLLAHLVAELGHQGVPSTRVVLLGFSQGACVALEFAARHPRRYGAVVGLSGALFGVEGTDMMYRGSLDTTPVFLGCSDVDRFIPLARLHESADVFRRMGADVDERIYIGMGHTVNRDEIDAIRALFCTVGHAAAA